MADLYDDSLALDSLSPRPTRDPRCFVPAHLRWSSRTTGSRGPAPPRILRTTGFLRPDAAERVADRFTGRPTARTGAVRWSYEALERETAWLFECGATRPAAVSASRRSAGALDDRSGRRRTGSPRRDAGRTRGTGGRRNPLRHRASRGAHDRRRSQKRLAAHARRPDASGGQVALGPRRAHQPGDRRPPAHQPADGRVPPARCSRSSASARAESSGRRFRARSTPPLPPRRAVAHAHC
jgi:hypothetical protein